jgi:cyanate permease
MMLGSLGIASFFAPALTGYLVSIQGYFNLAIMIFIGITFSSAFMMFFFHKHHIDASH